MRILVDIDHVVGDSSRRDFMIGSASWHDYHADGVNDEPVTVIVELVNALVVAGHHVVGFTAKPERYRDLTNKWMLKHKVMLTEIMMRPDGDFRPAIAIKSQFADDFEMDLVIDDRADVCQEINRRGVTTLQVTVRRRP